MRSAFAVTVRILRQFKHDPRTIFMMVIAPVLALFLLDIIFGSPEFEPLVLHDGASDALVEALEDAGARVEAAGRDDALARLDAAEADAFITEDGRTLRVWVEGSDATKTGAVLRAVAQARRATATLDIDLPVFELPDGTTLDLADRVDVSAVASIEEPEVTYVHGSADFRGFDYYGSVFIGVFVFFYVFITSGISFVRERTGGTLERLMATPIRRHELVLGYVQGFGLFSLIQTFIVAWASIYWVGFPNLGPFWLMLVVAESLALISLLLGIFVSEFANSELQVMQLMQIIVIPQILLSGMFDLSQTPGWMQALSRVFPLTYGAEAMRAVMLRGAGPADIAADLGVLWAFVAVLFVANALALKKYRAI